MTSKLYDKQFLVFSFEGGDFGRPWALSASKNGNMWLNYGELVWGTILSKKETSRDVVKFCCSYHIEGHNNKLQ